MYKAIAVVPTVAIVFMVLIAFWLPPDAGEKLILNGFACVLVCVFLIYFSQLLPVMSVTSPLIGKFERDINIHYCSVEASELLDSSVQAPEPKNFIAKHLRSFS